MADTKNTGYNAKSCNALEKPYYSPFEAAIRWCGLIEHEAAILSAMTHNGVQTPHAAMFPSWPCLRVNAEKIADAIEHGAIQHGRDGRPVVEGDHVAPPRRTVRHADLREWMSKTYPDQKPAFLFDEIERTTHAAINADTFRALQAELELCKRESERTKERWDKHGKEHEALLGERDALRGMVDDLSAKTKAKEDTEIRQLQRTLGALVLGLAKSSDKYGNNGLPNVSSIVGVAEQGGQDKGGKAPHGWGNTTFTNTINAALLVCQKELDR